MQFKENIIRAIDQADLEEVQTILLQYGARELTIEIIEYATTAGNLNVVAYLASLYNQLNDYSTGYMYVTRRTKCELNTDQVNKMLKVASEKGHLSLIKYWIAMGANATMYAMRESARIGNLEAIKFMLSIGAQLDGETLLLASCYGHLEVVKYITSVANIDLLEKYGRLSLEEASASGHLEIVKYLMSYNIPINNLAVTRAIARGHLHIIKHLMKEKFKYLQYFFDYALQHNQLNIVKYLHTIDAKLHITSEWTIGRVAESDLQTIKYVVANNLNKSENSIHFYDDICRYHDIDTIKYIYSLGHKCCHSIINYSLCHKKYVCAEFMISNDPSYAKVDEIFTDRMIKYFYENGKFNEAIRMQNRFKKDSSGDLIGNSLAKIEKNRQKLSTNIKKLRGNVTIIHKI